MRSLHDHATRPLLRSELGLVDRWAVREGWNPGLHDSRVFVDADPGSFFTVVHQGAPVGALSAVCLNAEFGFAGFFITAPECRNSYFGWVLLHAGLKRFGQRTIGAEAIPERLGIYTHHGLLPHSRSLSFTTRCPTERHRWSPGIIPASNVPFADISAYDCHASGLPRHSILKSWIAQPDSLAIGFVDHHRLRGFGAVRRAFRGVRIGPLLADDPEIAATLIDALEGFAPGEDISVSCPDDNPAGLQLLKSRGFVPSDSTIRIYRGRPPPERPGQVFGRMSLALG